MQLYGSTTSPYARRLRIFLAQADYQFINLDIFSAQGRQVLAQHNPTNKVPFLVDGQQTILDSRQIHRYLADKFQQPKLSWPQENLLSIIDAANDSLVSILLLQRSGYEVSDDKLFFNWQWQRIWQVFQCLEQELAAGSFANWHYPSICLYCLLDWVSFRHLVDVEQYPGLMAFYQQHQSRTEVQMSDPRLSP